MRKWRLVPPKKHAHMIFVTCTTTGCHSAAWIHNLGFPNKEPSQIGKLPVAWFIILCNLITVLINFAETALVQSMLSALEVANSFMADSLVCLYVKEIVQACNHLPKRNDEQKSELCGDLNLFMHSGG